MYSYFFVGSNTILFIFISLIALKKVPPKNKIKMNTKKQTTQTTMLVVALMLISSLMYLPKNAFAQNPGDVDTTWKFTGYPGGYYVGGAYIAQGYDAGRIFHVTKYSTSIISFSGGAIGDYGLTTESYSATIDNVLGGVSHIRSYKSIAGFNQLRLYAHTYYKVGTTTYCVAVGSANLRSAAYRFVVGISDNTWDTSFDLDGLSRITLDGTATQERFYDLAVQSDNKILAVGSVGTSSQKWSLARFNTDGSLDNTFGTGGKVILSLTGSSNAQHINLLSSGKFLVAGNTNGFTTGLVSRFNSNGTLDNTFGVNGSVSLPEAISDMEILSNGSILLSASSGASAKIYQYTSTGSIDSGFGVNGVAQAPASLFASICGIEVESSGKIYLGGTFYSSVNLKNQARIVLFNANGTVNTGFGSSGIVDINFNSGYDEACQTFVVDQNDNVIVATNCGNNGAFHTDWKAVKLIGGATIGILDVENQSGFLAIFPNPVDKDLNLSFELNQKQTVSITLFDIQGKQVYQFIDRAEMSQGKHQQLLNFPSGISAGEYNLVLTSGEM